MRINLVTLLTIGFFSVVMLRAGTMLDSAGYFTVKAEETVPDFEKITKKEKNIRDKIIKIQPDDKNGEVINPYGLKKIHVEREDNTDNVCLTGPILKAAKKRLEYLKSREKEIEEQARLIEIADRRVREQVAKLKLVKEQVIEQAQLADSKIAKESKRLISIYEKMNPKAAAGIFNEMSPNVAAELLRSMKEDQSSAILAKMTPKAAYNVTLALAHGIEGTKKDYRKIQ